MPNKNNFTDKNVIFHNEEQEPKKEDNKYDCILECAKCGKTIGYGLSGDFNCLEIICEDCINLC